jgi:RHS repeat-associated protein
MSHVGCLGRPHHLADRPARTAPRAPGRRRSDRSRRHDNVIRRGGRICAIPVHATGVRLYHFPQRTYSPRLGRWLQRDPLGYVDGVNLYEYARSMPTFFVDPFGLAVSLDLDPDPGSQGEVGGGTDVGDGDDPNDDEGPLTFPLPPPWYFRLVLHETVPQNGTTGGGDGGGSALPGGIGPVGFPGPDKDDAQQGKKPKRGKDEKPEDPVAKILGWLAEIEREHKLYGGSPGWFLDDEDINNLRRNAIRYLLSLLGLNEDKLLKLIEKLDNFLEKLEDATDIENVPYYEKIKQLYSALKVIDALLRGKNMDPSVALIGYQQAIRRIFDFAALALPIPGVGTILKAGDEMLKAVNKAISEPIVRINVKELKEGRLPRGWGRPVRPRLARGTLRWYGPPSYFTFD